MTSPERLAKLLALHHDPSSIGRKLGLIRMRLLATSPHLKTGQFEAIGTEDLELLFPLYDAEFFGGLLGRMLSEDSGGRIAFRLSSRLTSAGGKTTRLRRRGKPPAGQAGPFAYEIAVSTFLLFQNFGPDARPVAIAGLPCRDRMEALLRIFEHELLHLAEWLADGQSNCKGGRFAGLARSIFGHQDVIHEMITPREVAATTHAILVGDLVSFEFDGSTLVGRVNRITKRATILVPHPDGQAYSDGGRYKRFYVPLTMMRKSE